MEKRAALLLNLYVKYLGNGFQRKSETGAKKAALCECNAALIGNHLAPAPPAKETAITVSHRQGFVGNWGQEELQREEIYRGLGLIHLIRGSRCGGRASFKIL